MSKVKQTAAGTRYLTEAHVTIVAATSDCDGDFDYRGSRAEDFVAGLGFDEEDYMDDLLKCGNPAEIVTKFAGQLCYLSFGANRTRSDGNQRYFDNIKASGHGSVLEHVSCSLLFYGIDRALTHELVRHRAGMAYSQVSQRYVDGSTLRFVERPEWQADAELHGQFERRIDLLSTEYELLAEMLMRRQQAGAVELSAESKRDLRKRVNQAARSCLPNETEAPIIVTGNARAWRHFVEMRASPHADVTIRAAAIKALGALQAWAPMLFSDYEYVSLSDGTLAAETKWRKV